MEELFKSKKEAAINLHDDIYEKGIDTIIFNAEIEHEALIYLYQHDKTFAKIYNQYKRASVNFQKYLLNLTLMSNK